MKYAGNDTKGLQTIPKQENGRSFRPRGLAANTIEAYGRDLDSHLAFLESQETSFESAVRAATPTAWLFVLVNFKDSEQSRELQYLACNWAHAEQQRS